MPPITPDKPLGYQTGSMVVVICPSCRRKRWANKRSRKANQPPTARTTCCGDTVEYRVPVEDRPAPATVKK